MFKLKPHGIFSQTDIYVRIANFKRSIKQHIITLELIFPELVDTVAIICHFIISFEWCDQIQFDGWFNWTSLNLDAKWFKKRVVLVFSQWNLIADNFWKFIQDASQKLIESNISMLWEIIDLLYIENTDKTDSTF